MLDLLNLDLNEVISKEISEKISSLELSLKESIEANISLRKEISQLKGQVANSEQTAHLFNRLQDAFSKIKEGPKDDGGWFDSLQKKQFLFIEQILSALFGINKSYKGWYCSRNDGSLAVHIAVNYYEHKDILAMLLPLIMPASRSHEIVSFIDKFKMPYHYPKNAVLSYVKAPKYNTNASIFGVSNFWIEQGAGVVNMPHDLIMKNHHILEYDIFEQLIKSIKNKVPEFHYLFGLPTYNKSISDEQIKELGECLIGMPASQLAYHTPKDFISKFILKFNNATLDYLYTFTSDDNQFKLLHWQNFPVEYQMRYLKSKDFERVNKILNDYSCKWTLDQKRSFLKEYLAD